MGIDWSAFTPASALVGGAIIGFAAALLVLFNGRIAGISGIVGGLVKASRPEAWRVAFVAGLVAAPIAYAVLAPIPPVVFESGYPILVLAGLAVGIGTRYGSGCTSGHGVCGVARLSPRSMIATLAFMASGFATVFVVRHVLGI